MLKFFIKWSTATECPAPQIVPNPCTTSCWSVGGRKRWRGPHLRPCSGNWRSSLPWRDRTTRKLPMSDKSPTTGFRNLLRLALCSPPLSTGLGRIVAGQILQLSRTWHCIICSLAFIRVQSMRHSLCTGCIFKFKAVSSNVLVLVSRV